MFDSLGVIENEELIRELIKKDYKIPLNKIKEINFIFRKAKIKDEKDYKEFLSYLKWYTKKCQQQGHERWTFKDSASVYYRYLLILKNVENIKIYPTNDIWSITETMDKLINQNKKDFATQAYSIAKEHSSYNW